MIYTTSLKFRFYRKEVFDIIIAISVLTFAMALLMGGSHLKLYLPAAALAVITGFFIHEMAHKYMAFRFGYPAAFQAWYMGLVIAFASAFVGFIFAAPGAVVVYGYPSKRENGIISVAGPVANIVVGFFLVATVFFVSPTIGAWLFYTAYFNFFLAFFNLIPFPPMDGTKIIVWNLKIYTVLMILSILGVSLPYWIGYL